MSRLASVGLVLGMVLVSGCDDSEAGVDVDPRFVGSYMGVFCVMSISTCDGPLTMTIGSDGNVTGNLTLNSLGGYQYPFQGSVEPQPASGWPLIANCEIDPPGSDLPHPLRLKGNIDPDDPNLLAGVWLEGAGEVAADPDDSDNVWFVCRVGDTCPALE